MSDHAPVLSTWQNESGAGLDIFCELRQRSSPLMILQIGTHLILYIISTQCRRLYPPYDQTS